MGYVAFVTSFIRDTFFTVGTFQKILASPSRVSSSAAAAAASFAAGSFQIHAASPSPSPSASAAAYVSPALFAASKRAASFAAHKTRSTHPTTTMTIIPFLLFWAFLGLSLNCGIHLLV